MDWGISLRSMDENIGAAARELQHFYDPYSDWGDILLGLRISILTLYFTKRGIEQLKGR